MVVPVVVTVVCEGFSTSVMGGVDVTLPISGRAGNEGPCPLVRALEMAVRSGFLPAPQSP